MTSRWPVILLGTIVALLLAAAACAPAAEPKPAAPAPSQPAAGEPAKPTLPPGEESARYGGVLMMANATSTGHIPWEEAVTYSMQPIYPQANNVVQYQTWGDYVKGDYWNIVGDLAKSWEQSADGLKWTFRFQDGVKWTDGQPFTCGDAKWSLDTIRTGQDLRRSPRAIHLRVADKVDCADALTMVITLKRPQASFLGMLAGGPNTVWPKHLYEGKANLDKMREDPRHVGTGPFTMTEYIAGEKYVFQRKADYWKKPYPYLDGIEIKILATAALPSALRVGRLDMGYPSSNFGGSQAQQLLKECSICQFWPRFTSIGYTPWQINHQRPPWNVPAVKDALSYGIDKKKLADVCGEGWAIANAGFLHPDTPFALPKDRLAQLPGYNLDDPAGNKAKARELLAQAGFKPGDLSLAYNGASWSAPHVPCLTEDMEAIGIKTKADLYEVAKYYEVATAGDFNIMQGGFLTVSADPDATFYEYFYTGSDRNYGRYSNPELDRLIDLQSQTLDVEKRKALVWQIEETLIKEAAKIPLVMGQSMPITGPRVRNYLPGPTCLSQGTCFRLERVWLEQQ